MYSRTCQNVRIVRPDVRQPDVRLSTFYEALDALPADAPICIHIIKIYIYMYINIFICMCVYMHVYI